MSSFHLQNEWVDRHLARLSERRLKILMIYNRHANREGVAWPGMKSICEKLGIKNRSHVYTARNALVRMGFLVKLGPPHRRGSFRLASPQIAPDLGAIDCARNGRKSAPNSAPSCAQSGPRTAPETGPISINEVHTEICSNNTNDDVGDVLGKSEPMQETAAALIAVGVSAKAARQLAAANPWLTSDLVKYIHRNHATRGKNPAGLLLQIIRDANQHEIESWNTQIMQVHEADQSRAESERLKDAEQVRRVVIAAGIKIVNDIARELAVSQPIYRDVDATLRRHMLSRPDYPSIRREAFDVLVAPRLLGLNCDNHMLGTIFKESAEYLRPVTYEYLRSNPSRINGLL